ncbi:FecR domain-containing protein [Pinibacter soli]|uniref:FecR domain-containing protein n=1 Tax=Pinibacter soli TaxID=3044211 RepID=A0ABT6RGJ5_9BACT|nr:FecR domain-containing protein [Pinibacter soli]MDI3321682.1 FecR domain-containing protein [Pinibacter soli]
MNTDLHDINDELLVKFLLGEASPAESTSISQWIATSADNEKYFNDFKLIWDNSLELASKSTVDENAAWQRFQQMIAAKEESAKAPVVPITGKNNWLRVAAIVFVVITGAISYFIWQENKPAAQINIASTSATLNDTLPDGSMVTLNKNTKISYADHFKGKTRNLKLQGEAFFKVATDKDKPFIVNVNDVTITVLGTSFNVKNNNGETEVIVESGLVRVEHLGKKVDLKPNEKAVISSSNAALQKESSTDKLYNYYSSRQFVCDKTPLWKLVEKLNEAYDVNITIENPSVKSLPLTTTFNDESLDNVLKIISETLDVKVERNGNNITLK